MQVWFIGLSLNDKLHILAREFSNPSYYLFVDCAEHPLITILFLNLSLVKIDCDKI